MYGISKHDSDIFHAETLIPFTEAVKLERGNANVRPASETKKPYKDMIDTVESNPETFHLKNRGITYICDRFEFDNASKRFTVTIPSIAEENYQDDGMPKFGIADGGHTFSVIQKIISSMDSLKEANSEWLEPFVRVHLLSGKGSQEASVEGIVEALNTSSQVQQYTLDEYNNLFDELKDALQKAGFDVSLIAFRENEEKEWHVLEIIQRLACFLKDRWVDANPAAMYKSKGKALDLFTTDATRPEFRKLFDVIKDVITFPEFIQSKLSMGNIVEPRSLGRLRSVKTSKKPFARPGTLYQSRHRLDLAALLPMAAAFRELLQTKGDRYQWRVSPYEVFERCAENLYKALLSRSAKVKSNSSLGSDMEYWGTCAQIVMRTQTAMIEERHGAK
jgi:AIPR protein